MFVYTFDYFFCYFRLSVSKKSKKKKVKQSGKHQATTSTCKIASSTRENAFRIQNFIKKYSLRQGNDRFAAIFPVFLALSTLVLFRKSFFKHLNLLLISERVIAFDRLVKSEVQMLLKRSFTFICHRTKCLFYQNNNIMAEFKYESYFCGIFGTCNHPYLRLIDTIQQIPHIRMIFWWWWSKLLNHRPHFHLHFRYIFTF